VVPKAVTAGFATIAEQEGDIRRMRLRAMEDG
jgi:hypothetical protein